MSRALRRLQCSALTWCALLSLPLPALGDLPVHCERHQVAGDWDFVLSPPSSSRSSCGHKHPDDQNQQPPLSFVSSQSTTHNLRVSLRDPSTAVSADKSQNGSWTMIYDEGFEVKIGGQVFFAFSYFEWVQGADGKKTNISHCDATQVGWYHDVERTQWGCYTGRKVGTAAPLQTAPVLQQRAKQAPASEQSLAPDTEQLTDQVDSGDDSAVATAAEQTAQEESSSAQEPADDPAATVDAVAQVDSPPPSDEGAQAGDDQQTADIATATAAINSQDQATAGNADDLSQPPQHQDLYTPWVPNSEGFDHPIQGEWQQSVADALNFLQLGWTASAYPKFRGKTPRELNRLAGVRRSRAKSHGPAPVEAPAAAPVSSFLGLSSNVKGARHKGHHRHVEHLDWRHKDGHNWLTHVVEQGDCGSCYTISTVHMLTARHRIAKHDKTLPAFSVSFPLYCSEFNQGCDGGYGFLQTKWSEDVGLVPESCMAFSQGGGSCHSLSGCDLGATRFRAVNHHYVGGYYGGSDAASIKHELVQHGPMVMSFEPKEDFMYYKNGVYKSGARKIHEEWEQVDHAVLLVGFGADQGQDYWTMQNSWGTDWGERGYFRMARGIDESGCESIVVAAEVVEESSNEVLDQFLASL
mmetsp:Transcript_72708/g.204147  ORF Transcript_72708/g.204147 Transcript_72708/m.204147 type:complete len:637 (+) Transcript_72708:131-2041(+)|eukprot:CAMPEP_0176229108 /NCGR_PEP_ID=MMETSP0121_2-20121125/23619_1 /TAXON_ID=160619 /ORGANISM="Kryptoperidinium foliaceum, Strain CCMP 1326" /LENGTH=636 /DNA_ID=CAMNT_0017568421 /DNA_START=11 /DNA_END=1921 /DNA_ORIENTATION=+